MKTEVTEQGINIPKQFLEGVKEVEIRKEKNYILVIPISAKTRFCRLAESLLKMR